MLVTSRSLAEYRAMFDLPDRPAGSVLDCSAGASGFLAETVAEGIDAVAVDPAYRLAEPELADAVRRSLVDGGGIIDRHPDRFVWDWYGSRRRRDKMRARAAERFLADRRRRPGRYVAGALPDLPFRDGSFDVVLCSHLLFTWSDRFGADWHVAALREMARVGRQVRVFPLVGQGAGDPVPFLDEVRARLDRAGVTSEIRAVPYEFQRGADHMLVAGAAPGQA